MKFFKHKTDLDVIKILKRTKDTVRFLDIESLEEGELTKVEFEIQFSELDKDVDVTLATVKFALRKRGITKARLTIGRCTYEA